MDIRHGVFSDKAHVSLSGCRHTEIATHRSESRTLLRKAEYRTLFPSFDCRSGGESLHFRDLGGYLGQGGAGGRGSRDRARWTRQGGEGQWGAWGGWVEQLTTQDGRLRKFLGGAYLNFSQVIIGENWLPGGSSALMLGSWEWLADAGVLGEAGWCGQRWESIIISCVFFSFAASIIFVEHAHHVCILCKLRRRCLSGGDSTRRMTKGCQYKEVSPDTSCCIYLFIIYFFVSGTWWVVFVILSFFFFLLNRRSIIGTWWRHVLWIVMSYWGVA